MAKNIFIGSTHRYDGMTSVCLGLIHAFLGRTAQIGYIKPVGQLDRSAGSYSLNDDPILIEKVCRIHCNLQDMSPVTYRKGFPQEELFRTNPDEMQSHVRSAYDRIEADKDLVVIEGSGHAAIGSMLSLSNARVAAMFGAKVILVTAARTAEGSPIDNIFLNMAYYERHGVEVIGVIINKVVPDTPQFLRLYVIKALARRDIPLLGVIPYEPSLCSPTMAQVLKVLKGRVINGATNLSAKADTILVGAMSPRRALTFLMEQACNNLLLITGADRTGLITTALSVGAHDHTNSGIAGMVLTGGREPEKSVLDLLARTRIPVILVDGDTFSSATKVDHMEVKIEPNDKERIGRIQHLVQQNVDLKTIEKAIGWS